MKKIVSYTVACILLTAMAYFGMQGYTCSTAHEKVSRTIVERHNVSELGMNKLKKLADMLSLGLYDGYEDYVAEEKNLERQQQRFKQQAVSHAIYFTGAACLLLLLYFVMSLQEYTIVLSLGALIALAAGLLSPVMMMSIHKEVEYLGDVVLMIEFKGVLGSIVKLFASRDYVVGGTLLLFSIVFPLSKTICMLFVAVFVRSRAAHTLVHFFKILGKWSMADVFVVATFLVYLSAAKGEMSRAEIQVGFYFFLAYVILSMLTSISAAKMLQESRTA